MVDCYALVAALEGLQVHACEENPLLFSMAKEISRGSLGFGRLAWDELTAFSGNPEMSCS